MQVFDIIPKTGVGPVKIGMSRADVHSQLGSPDQIVREREWHLDGMAIDYDSEGKVELIELANSNKFKAFFCGKCLHEIAAEEVVAFVESFAPYDFNNSELGYSYVFPELQISLWRAVLPEKSQPSDDLAGRYFEAVGVAREGYFK